MFYECLSSDLNRILPEETKFKTIENELCIENIYKERKTRQIEMESCFQFKLNSV